MAIDLLEKLAELPVPPPPAQEPFDRAVHRRINQRLLVGQIFDFSLRGCGFAAIHFAKAVVGCLRLTVTGKFDDPKNRGTRPQ
jgi:hypothetical protein